MKPTTRRSFLRSAVQLAVGALALPGVARAALPPASRSLAFSHTHSGERISLVYAVGDHYVPAALAALNRFLRDHYSGAVGRIDPLLFDQLHRLQLELGRTDPFHVISGYRCAETNRRLRSARGGGVARRSLHMDGKAIDLRLPGVPLAELRDAAVQLGLGGVGYYPRDQFVHLDTGRVRHW